MEAIEFFQDIKVPVTVVHVLGVVFGMGGALISDALFSFFSKDKKLGKMEMDTLSFLAKIILYSLFVIVISGLVIFFSSPNEYIHSAKFLAKMSILGVLLLNGYFLNKYVWPHLLDKGFFTSARERNIRRLAFVCGAISVISWLAVFTLGVLDNLAFSYNAIIGIYLVVTFFGVGVALAVEKRELD